MKLILYQLTHWLLSILNRFDLDMKFMSPKSHFRFLDGIRKDYFVSGHLIVFNPEWICCPSIAYEDDKGPVILTCRFHSHSSIGRYLHLPISPTPTIFTPASDQYAPVVVCPKTIHTVQARQYSDSFQFNHMDGHYEGIDTLHLCTSGHYNVANALSEQRDQLAMVARHDIIPHIGRLEEDGILPSWFAKEKIDAAKETYKEADLERIRIWCRHGATHIPLADAMEMDYHLKWDGGVTIMADDGNGGRKRLHFHASWPKFIIHCHPSDKYGSKFCTIPSLPDIDCCDGRSMWVTVACAKVMTEKNMMSDYFMQFNNGVYDPVFLKELFSQGGYSPKIVVCEMGELIESVGSLLVSSDTKVIVAYRNLQRNIRHRFKVPDEIGIFELRLVISTSPLISSWNGSLFVKHGGPSFPLWWQQKRKDRAITKCLDGPTRNIRINCDVCV